MKQILKLALVVALVAGLGSCHGQVDDSVEVQLVATPSSIVADGEQSVSFQVLYGASPVTAEAQIVLVSHPEMGWSGSSFATEEPGNYIFKAYWRDMESAEVEVVATEPVGEHTSQFARHICIMDLTGAWCSNCPSGFRSLNGILENPFADWKEIVHVMALHDNSGGVDPMGLNVTPTVLSTFGIGGYPGWVTDMREGGLLTDDIIYVRDSFDRSLEEYPAHCGVKIESRLAQRELEVEITVFAELAGDYAVCVWLLEDGVVGPQLDGSIQYDEWTHNHVARAYLSSNWKGDLLGTLAASQEGSKNYTYSLPAEWNAEKMHIVALAIDAKGYVNNVIACPVGESADYDRL